MRDGSPSSTVVSTCRIARALGLEEAGLDRYDGYSIREYRVSAVDAGLASDYIWAIAEDR